MLRLWFPQIALAVFLAAGAIAWGSLSLRGSNEWVFIVTRGMWSDNIRELSAHDVAIVPGAVFRDGRPVPVLEERLNLALGLYRSGRVATILVSGDEAGQEKEASGMRQWLIDHGVPAARVTADPLGVRTLATMTRAAHVFDVRSAIICTQRLHAPRSVFLARGAGIDAVALVPPSAPRNASVNERTEHLKITLAFLEHYVFRRTAARSSSADLVPATLATAIR
jgi:SanA protein